MCNLVYTYLCCVLVEKKRELVLRVGDLVLRVGGKEERIGAVGCCCLFKVNCLTPVC